MLSQKWNSILAIWGCVTGTVALLYPIYRLFKDVQSGRVRLDAYARATSDGNHQYLEFVITNIGSRPVTISRVFVLNPDMLKNGQYQGFGCFESSVELERVFDDVVLQPHQTRYFRIRQDTLNLNWESARKGLPLSDYLYCLQVIDSMGHGYYLGDHFTRFRKFGRFRFI
ncbi:MAG: hypothetical protein ACM3SR_08160 [Ignavibacteriales bacterium]